MKTLKHLIFVILASPLLISSCGSDECKSFRNEVPTELPPNLKAQLHGLLTYNKWVLANDEGDTMIYEAEGPYSDGIRETQAGKDPVCKREYVGTRTYSVKIFYSSGNIQEYENELKIGAASRKVFSVRGNFGTFSWNNVSDQLQDSGSTIFMDSLALDNEIFYQVFYNNNQSPQYCNAAIGKIASNLGLYPIFYLKHYE